MYCTAEISRTLPFPLAQASQTVSAISCKIVTIWKVQYLLNGIAKSLNHKKVWANTRPLICHLKNLNWKSCKLILSAAIFLQAFLRICGKSLSFQAAILKQEVVLMNMVPSIATITCSHQLLLSMDFITCGHHCWASFSGIKSIWKSHVFLHCCISVSN